MDRSIVAETSVDLDPRAAEETAPGAVESGAVESGAGVTTAPEMDAELAVTRAVPETSGRPEAAGGAAAAGAPSDGFVALSRFEVANGMTAEVKQAFRDRPHLVDGAPGFLRMDVISPVDASDEIWLITYWTDEQSYRSWHRSHVYRESHGGIPKGLKLRPSATELRYFDHICS